MKLCSLASLSVKHSGRRELGKKRGKLKQGKDDEELVLRNAFRADEKKGKKKNKDKSGSSDENFSGTIRQGIAASLGVTSPNDRAPNSSVIQKVAVVLKSANDEPYKLVKGKDGKDKKGQEGLLHE